MGTRTCIAIRHVAFEDLGSFAPALAAAGWDIRYVEAGCDDIAALDPVAADLLVVLGGPIGAYEEEPYPFLADELRLLEARLKAGRPTLGICLGAQLIARVLGAPVYPNAAGKEIGWSPLAITAAGRDSVLAPLEGVEVLHWHGDTFDLPAGAELLASTPVTRNQAFKYGETVLGLQFHVEAQGSRLEQWLIGHAAELAAAKIGPAELRRVSTRCAPVLEARAAEVLARFLAATGG